MSLVRLCPNSCKMVTAPAARKDILIKQGRCFVCLRNDHFSKNCPSKHECFKCKGKHHISICPSKGNNGTNISRTTSKQEHPQKQSVNYCPSGSNVCRLFLKSHTHIGTDPEPFEEFKTEPHSLTRQCLYSSPSSNSQCTNLQARKLSRQSESLTYPGL